MPVHVYLVPGMFGRIGSFDYFGHVRDAIESRYAARGRRAVCHVADVHPTASIRRRADALMVQMLETAGDEQAPVHLVGHSTGGLDARLLASPTSRVLRDETMRPRCRALLERLASITTINTPHRGTPLAAFFATKSGQQALYALMALTVTGLKLGAPPLALASALLAALGRIGGAAELPLIERVSESLIKVLDDASSRELRSFLRQIRADQGTVIQLTPEAMDIFEASVVDRPGVRYQSVASFAPAEAPRKILGSILSPWSVVSSAIFAVLYNLTKEEDERYPTRPADPASSRAVATLLGELPPASANDGVVPFYSQIWGEILWVGRADHLDVVGHYPGGRARRSDPHVDWLRSGAGFDDNRFETVMDRVVDGMILAEEASSTLRGRVP
jgi:pimeloyl-ACP methyl ester carboxylesterase